jgi:hypothetical protein
MNKKFGIILAQDILSLMAQVEDQQGHPMERSKSTGSGTLSLDSYDGEGGVFVDQFPVFTSKSWRA